MGDGLEGVGPRHGWPAERRIDTRLMTVPVKLATPVARALVAGLLLAALVLPAAALASRKDVAAEIDREAQRRDLLGAVARHAAAHGGRALVVDQRLEAVAATVALNALGTPLDPAGVRARLWSEGLRDFEFLPITVVAADGDVGGALAHVLGDSAVPWGRYNTAAVAVRDVGGRRAACVLLTRRVASMEPDGELVRVFLPEGYERPELFVTLPDGRVERRPLDADGRGWRFARAVAGPVGTALVELMVEGPRGPEVAALWPQATNGEGAAASVQGAAPPPLAPDPYAGRPIGSSPDLLPWLSGSAAAPDRPPAPEDVQAAEQQLWALMQSTRSSRGLPRLRSSAELSRAARRQAGDLGRGEPFGHVTSSGTALDRIAAEGLVVARAAENVGVVDDIPAAHAAFLASPAHRANLLDPELTEGGVGVVLRRDGRGRWSAVVSEVFAALPDVQDAAGYPARAAAAVNGARVAAKLPELSRRRRLDVIAADAARAAASGDELGFPPGRRAALTEEVRFHFNSVRHIGWDVVATPDPDAVARARHAADPRYSAFGVGVHELTEALGSHPAGTRVFVLLYVER